MTADEIRQLRAKLKLTQRELAERLLVSREALALWETGKRKPQRVYLEAMRKLAGVTR